VATTAAPPTKTVTLTIGGQKVTVAGGTPIRDAAKSAGTDRPPEDEGGDPLDPEGSASQDPEGGASQDPERGASP
jgi:hypothetical protein